MGKEIYRNRVIAITGHRPDKLGGYSEDIYRRLVEMYVHVFKDLRPARVISGMALGADQAAAEAAISLEIPVIAAVPFEGQESRWPEMSQIQYHNILDRCSEVVVVCDGGFAGWKMQKRNEWMVDHSELLLTLWNGTPGGTGNCVEYAKKVKKEMLHLWVFWKERTY